MSSFLLYFPAWLLLSILHRCTVTCVNRGVSWRRRWGHRYRKRKKKTKNYRFFCVCVCVLTECLIAAVRSRCAPGSSNVQWNRDATAKKTTTTATVDKNKRSSGQQEQRCGDLFFFFRLRKRSSRFLQAGKNGRLCCLLTIPLPLVWWLEGMRYFSDVKTNLSLSIIYIRK